MIIVSLSQDFHAPGLDFYLNYYDDPKAQIPKMAMSWMATSGLPDWLNKLHKAAKRVPKPIERVDITDDYEVVLIKEKNEKNFLNQELQVQTISSPDEALLSSQEDKVDKSNDTLIDPTIDTTLKLNGVDKSNDNLIDPLIDSTVKDVSNVQVEPKIIEENISPIILDTINETQIEPPIIIPLIKEEENNIPTETSSETKWCSIEI
jgi:hypothetical protein